MEIHGIDYSRPGYKEMFANFGLTILASQALEKTLLLLLASINCLEVGKVSKEDLYQVLNQHNRKTLGQLINALRKKVEFPKNLEADLCVALEKRNYITHHFFMDKLDILRLSRAPDKLSQELLPIRDFLLDVQRRVDSVLEVVQNQAQITSDRVEEEAKQLLKI